MLKHTAFFATTILLVTMGRAGAQQVDPCIALWDTTIAPTPDSLWVDTCSASPLFRDFYAKRRFEVDFAYYVITTPYTHIDTTIIRSWTDINSNYQALRDSFQQISQTFGTFTFLKQYQYIEDTGSELNRIFWISFDTILNVDSVLARVKAFPDVSSIEFRGYPVYGTGGVNQSSLQSNIALWPQPCTNELFIRGQPLDNISFYDPLGRQIKLPIETTDGMLTIDVSNQPSGVLYANVSGQFFKILIQK
jgi:hypothetical protein